MKQCLECGTFSSDDTVFCSVCGKRFSDATDVSVIENNKPENENTHNYDGVHKITNTTHPEIMSLNGQMNTVNAFLTWSRLTLMPILVNFLWNSDAPRENS